MVGQLIRERRLAKSWSQEHLAEALGTTQRQVTRWEGYTTQMPREFTRSQIGSALGISPADWHMAAANAARQNNNQPQAAPARPHQLTESELFERFGIRPYDQPRSVDGLALSAGSGAGVPQGIDDTLPRKVPGRRYLWEAPVVGDCMEDEIHAGEVVIYSTRMGAELGKIMVALRDEEELLIKRLVVHNGAQMLRPNRGDDVPVDDRIRFLGRAVSVQRPLL